MTKNVKNKPFWWHVNWFHHVYVTAHLSQSFSGTPPFDARCWLSSFELDSVPSRTLPQFHVPGVEAWNWNERIFLTHTFPQAKVTSDGKYTELGHNSLTQVFMPTPTIWSILFRVLTFQIIKIGVSNWLLEKSNLSESGICVSNGINLMFESMKNCVGN